jgi:hypothetical protein
MNGASNIIMAWHYSVTLFARVVSTISKDAAHMLDSDLSDRSKLYDLILLQNLINKLQIVQLHVLNSSLRNNVKTE